MGKLLDKLTPKWLVRDRVKVMFKPVESASVSNLASGDAIKTGLGSQLFHLNQTEAMRTAVVWRCVNLISGAISQLTWRVKGTPELYVGRLERLLNVQPSRLIGAATWKELVVRSILLEGDHANRIVRKGSRAIGILPARSIIRMMKKEGTTFYTLDLPTDDGSLSRTDHVIVQQDNVLHFTGAGQSPFFDRAPSVVRDVLRSAIDLYKTQENFSLEFFKHPPYARIVALTDYEKVDESDAITFGESWDRNYNKASHMGKPAVLARKFREIVQLSLNLREMQMTEGKSFQIEDIIRAFGIPGFLVNHADKGAWGQGMTEIANAFLRYTLMPYIVRIENELNRKLGSDQISISIDTNDFTRATEKERYEYIQKAIGNGNTPGFITINEARAMLGLDPVEGDVYDVPYSGREPQQSATEGPNLPPADNGGNAPADEPVEETADA